jgi:hypothetical protein
MPILSGCWAKAPSEASAQAASIIARNIDFMMTPSSALSAT